ncbi:hypothetical protein RHGRI_033438 [Rhododendron griersonianum]|uniref:4a-hydroxytetrahydrobiopterin dehydratase n=1 Tax=Rhododendron griersonianum TaxID=479676 RepID=A0AAV6HX67_9ERIC|nr:hypothetical protein RHGRI_033438 [Rhododendron griersonianum]
MVYILHRTRQREIDEETEELVGGFFSDEEDKDEIQILEPEQGSGGLLRRRKSLFEATSSAKERKDASQISKPDLSTKKCVPCMSIEMRVMTEQEAHELISQVPEWDLVNEGGRLRLSRSWKVKTFLKGLEFFQAVANVAEAEGHHPDLHLVEWNNVKIEIWTHAVGGLTESDFIIAAKIDRLNAMSLFVSYVAIVYFRNKNAPMAQRGPDWNNQTNGRTF